VVSARRDRCGSIAAYEIPRCIGSDWLVKPDANMQGGQVRHCSAIATYRIRWKAAHRHELLRWTVCAAHFAGELEHAVRDCRFARELLFLRDVVDPVVTRLTVTADTRAASYGRERYTLVESPCVGPGQMALLAPAARLPEVPQRRREPAASVPVDEPAQGALF
jgi:hypothetical protein